MQIDKTKIGERIFYVKKADKRGENYWFGHGLIKAIVAEDIHYAFNDNFFPLKDIDQIYIHVDEDDNGEKDYDLELFQGEFFYTIEEYVLKLNLITQHLKDEPNNGGAKVNKENCI